MLSLLVKLIHEPVIQLTRLTIPFLKLSKLFFKKLSRAGMNKNLTSSFTEMNSIQLECLCNSAGLVSSNLSTLTDLLVNADANDGAIANPVNSLEMIQVTETLASQFKTPVQLEVLYLISLVAETGGLPDQNYYKDYFLTWNTQFTLAIHNFVQFVQTI
ncbi:hypothetical protein KEM48_000744 [Puccinia striiformis f. sp. tritici PST-130]|nr:hypothetical protein Pst134EB_001208 [Puccinia striiformis f. sp. tritici]KAI9601721.1 hypothetical protein H4Q26_001554 [Puccinia striiformis f. sp. tritici PST-130]KAI9604509.1 hypothetical protein KEM48_000744 [Puccinia striiformis f. sp. tritici PST-130]